MSDWLSYRLSDFLLFSPQTYYRLFELYNLALWPSQILVLLLGILLLVLSRRGGPWPGRLVPVLLALAWFWVAWGYLATRYATINWAAGYLAVGFALQGLLLLLFAGRLSFGAGPPGRLALGAGLAFAALFLQPLLAPLSGRGWLQAELFGLMPDPTAAFTLGLLLTADRLRWPLLILPLAWCAVAWATLHAMDSPEAWLLPLFAAVTLAGALWRRRER